MNRSHVLIAALAFAAPTSAQSPEPPAAPPGHAPPVEDLVREAVEHNHGVAATRARLQVARERAAAAGALPDPMAELMWTEAAMEGFPRISLGEEPMSMLGVEVRQGLLYPGKRAAARGVALAGVDVGEREIEIARREAARDVRQAYARIYAADRQLELLGASRELLDLLVETTAARYGANQASQEAVLKAQLARSRLLEQIADARAERAVTVALLGRVLDREADFDLPPVAALPPVGFPGPGWAARAVEGSAEIAARRAALEQARRRVAAARRDLKPNLFAAASTSVRGAIDPVVTLRFGVEWPWWRRDKQLPLVRAAEQELEMATHDLLMAEAMILERARAIDARREQAEQQVALYREGLVPQTEAALGAARSEFLAGLGDFSTVIEDFNLWLEARTQLARREADRYGAWADVQALLGTTVAATGGER